jgi:hypothetical protein
VEDRAVIKIQARYRGAQARKQMAEKTGGGGGGEETFANPAAELA